jgi:hypothetical protein
VVVLKFANTFQFSTTLINDTSLEDLYQLLLTEVSGWGIQAVETHLEESPCSAQRYANPL